MKGAELARLVEFTEGAAHADMFGAAPAGSGLEVDASDRYVARFAPSMDVMMFNRAVGLGVRVPASEDSVANLVARYHERGLRNFAIQLSPFAGPPSVSEWLVNQGLVIRDYWTKLYRTASTEVVYVPTDLRIERINRTHARVFAEVACEAFGMPDSLVPIVSAPVGLNGWRHYIAWDGSKPVAVAALMIKPPVAWLGIAATLPDYRRRGAQGALMTLRIREAIAEGCEWIVTETGKDLPDEPNPSYHNMLRTGFIVAYDRPNYMLPP